MPVETLTLKDRSLAIYNRESKTARRIWLGIAMLFVVVFGCKTFSWWAPADGGVDQNAYLLGGRMMAEHFSTRYTLPSPYAYVGGMMIRTSKANVPGGDYYPKYPLGLPLLYAAFFWVFGANHAASWAFSVSPICAILAVIGMFFLARLMCGSFAALMAAILLGTSQLMIELSNNPNSHASCVAFIVWGMYLLLKWWQSDQVWAGLGLGIGAGLLLGYAGLIRYSEGLLALPIAVVCASKMRWTNWASYFRCAVPGLAWAVPIAVMLFYNKHSMGSWTGYDSTNESEGFTWLKFTQTWEQMFRTYYDTAAVFVLPLGISGILIAFGRTWKLGLMLLMWLLPGTALYTAYYWSPDQGISYARFFLVFLPAIMLGVAICFSDAVLAPVRDAIWYRKLPRASAVVVVTFIAASLGVYRSVHGMQQGQGGMGRGNQSLAEQQHVRQNLVLIGQALLKHVPADSALFVDSTGGGAGMNERPLNYIQFLRHWDCYSTDAFDSGGPRQMLGRVNNLANNFGLNAPADPNPVPTTRQQLQVDYLAWLYKKPSAEIRADKTKLIDDKLKAGQGVFALAPVASDLDARRFFNLVGKYKITVVESWSDLPPLPPDPVAENLGNTNGRNRGRNFPGGGGAGGGRRGGGGFGSGTDPSPIKWELLEIQPAK